MFRNSLVAGTFLLTALAARAENQSTDLKLDQVNSATVAQYSHTQDADVDESVTLEDNMSSDNSLDKLRDGNSRYVLGESTFPRADATRRYETASEGQHPFATILTCSDSRVPPELIFDTGLGDLFVIRVAGNVADVDEIASIEYGTEHLKTPVVVVMGHTACGAVTAVANGAELHDHLAELTNNILPAVTDAKGENPKLTGERLITQSIRWNVRQAQADLIEHSETIRGLVSSGKLKVVGAIYDLHSGSVLWLGEHPNQSNLLDPAANNDYTHFEPPEHHESPAVSKPTSHAKRPPAMSSNHGEPSTTSDHDEKGSQASSPVDDNHAEPTESAIVSKSEKHGLMIPAMFMLGGVALSSTLVFVIRTRRPLPSQPKSSNNSH